MAQNRWLMKAEPDSRIVKGKDVKFSVDDFEAMGTTAWEGVRNHEAKNLMKSMKVGDQVLFYHSNCKNPGVAGFAEVSKEAYPDHTAWDPDHPYYDEKSDQANPRWYMVDLRFKARAKYLVPLSLIKRIASVGNTPPEDVGYLGEEGVKAIQAMALVNRGRLSVQSVDESAWEAISLLAERGGWEVAETGGGIGKKRIAKEADTKEENTTKGRKSKRGRGGKSVDEVEEGDKSDDGGVKPEKDETEEQNPRASVKRPRRTAAIPKNKKGGIASEPASSTTRSNVKSRKSRVEESMVGNEGSREGGDVGEEESDLTELSEEEDTQPKATKRARRGTVQNAESSSKSRTKEKSETVNTKGRVASSRGASTRRKT